MFDFITVTKALTDENRARILMALRGRSLCVCQVTGLLDLSPSTTSKHLSILKQARLITGRKNGKWVYYTLPDMEKSSPIVRRALAFVLSSLEHSPEIMEDEHRIRRILESESSFCPDHEHPEEADNVHSPFIHLLAGADEEE